MSTTPQISTHQALPPSANYQSILQQYIGEELLNGRMQVEVDDDLLIGEIIDSMGMMRLVAFVEETFAILVPLEDITIQNFRTIGAIDAYLVRRGGHGG